MLSRCGMKVSPPVAVGITAFDLEQIAFDITRISQKLKISNDGKDMNMEISVSEGLVKKQQEQRELTFNSMMSISEYFIPFTKIGISLYFKKRRKKSKLSWSKRKTNITSCS